MATLVLLGGCGGVGSGVLHKAGLQAPMTNCVSCHGASLQGGDGPSCTSCHGQTW